MKAYRLCSTFAVIAPWIFIGGPALADDTAHGSFDVRAVVPVYCEINSDAIVLQGSATSRDEAIDEAGRLLVAAGAVDPSYVEAMHEREKSVSTHMGNGLAIPHGTNEAKGAIHRSAISFVRYSDPVDWAGKPAECRAGLPLGLAQKALHFPLPCL